MTEAAPAATGGLFGFTVWPVITGGQYEGHDSSGAKHLSSSMIFPALSLSLSPSNTPHTQL